MIVVGSDELVYLVVVLQELLLCWVLSMAEDSDPDSTAIAVAVRR